MKKKIIIQYATLGLGLLVLILQPSGTFGELIEDTTVTEEVVQGTVLEGQGDTEVAQEDSVMQEDDQTPAEEPQDTPSTLEDENVVQEEDSAILEEDNSAGEIEEIQAVLLPEDLNEEELNEENNAILTEIQEAQEDLSASVIWKGQNVSQKDLKNTYQLTFSEDFADIMSAIEEEYRLEYTLDEQDVSTLYATNWQDVIARYLLEKKRDGEMEFHLAIEDKEGIQQIYREMNRLIYIKDESLETTQTRILYRNLIPTTQFESIEETFQYQNLKIEDIINLDQSLSEPVYSEEEREFLQRYASEECRILSAGATRAGGFLQQLEDEVSQARQEVLKAAFQTIGRVPYFWGGKSTAIGLDSRIGKPAVVSAGGSTTTGSTRAYGLDCSGFVSWAFLNGAHYSGSSVASVGAGTIGQWAASVGISQEEAKPGDLVFLASPKYVQGINHVGIVVGKDSEGGLLAIHCNAGDNGVVVESAYSAGFRYVRRPLVFNNETIVD